MVLVKRGISFLLTLTLLIGILPPINVSASENEVPNLIESDELAVEQSIEIPVVTVVTDPIENEVSENETQPIETIEQMIADQQKTTDTDMSKFDSFYYQVLLNGEVIICGLEDALADEALFLVIPDEIEGKPVTQIAEEAFLRCSKINAILIPESVSFVGKSAFEKCKNLETIAFGGSEMRFDATTVKDCVALSKVLVLARWELTDIEALFEEDLGIEQANEIEYLLFEDINSLENAFAEFVEETEVSGSQNAENSDVATQEETVTNTEETSPSNVSISEETETYPATSDVTSEFSYTVLNGTYCQVTGYTGNETAITIPSEINGYIVQSIGNNAFKGKT
ncbi:MAG: leucine-rich repeat protein, partial [Bacteroidaceae bacterium]|nr:leucine-rich repeat protein [Bacteroidaceae bacterium]